MPLLKKALIPTVLDPGSVLSVYIESVSNPTPPNSQETQPAAPKLDTSAHKSQSKLRVRLRSLEIQMA